MTGFLIAAILVVGFVLTMKVIAPLTDRHFFRKAFKWINLPAGETPFGFSREYLAEHSRKIVSVQSIAEVIVSHSKSVKVDDWSLWECCTAIHVIVALKEAQKMLPQVPLAPQVRPELLESMELIEREIIARSQRTIAFRQAIIAAA